MKPEELERLEAGRKILGEINKFKAQLKSVERANAVKIFSTNDYKAEIEGKEKVNIDFQTNTNANDPFGPQAKGFIEQFRRYLQTEIETLEEEFKSL